MTYKITKNKFDIQNGTARITVHMKYIDGTNIYAATIQEYTRKIAVAAYAGKEMTGSLTLICSDCSLSSTSCGCDGSWPRCMPGGNT